jgi:hypothetical protein
MAEVGDIVLPSADAIAMDVDGASGDDDDDEEDESSAMQRKVAAARRERERKREGADFIPLSMDSTVRLLVAIRCCICH